MFKHIGSFEQLKGQQISMKFTHKTPTIHKQKEAKTKPGVQWLLGSQPQSKVGHAADPANSLLPLFAVTYNTDTRSQVSHQNLTVLCLRLPSCSQGFLIS